MNIKVIAMTFAAVLIAAPLHAQTPRPEVRVQLIEQLRPGTVVRILVGAQTITGRIQRVSADTLYVDQTPMPTGTIENAWLKQRATRRGMKIGAIVGAPAGAAFGAFLFTFASGLCETECSDNPGRDIVLGTLGLGAAGLIGGAALGAVIGAALPHWVEIANPRAKLAQPPAAPDREHRIGSISLTPAYARFAGSDENGGGARFAYMFHTQHFSLGPEVGRYGAGERRVSHAGGIFRVGTGADRTLEAFANVGVGLYSWGVQDGGAIQLGGYSVGAGAQVRSTSRRFSALTEARWQSNLTRSGTVNPDYGFYTLAVGGAIAW